MSCLPSGYMDQLAGSEIRRRWKASLRRDTSPGETLAVVLGRCGRVVVFILTGVRLKRREP